jgi:hypothetical protein
MPVSMQEEVAAQALLRGQRLNPFDMTRREMIADIERVRDHITKNQLHQAYEENIRQNSPAVQQQINDETIRLDAERAGVQPTPGSLLEVLHNFRRAHPEPTPGTPEHQNWTAAQRQATQRWRQQLGYAGETPTGPRRTRSMAQQGVSLTTRFQNLLDEARAVPPARAEESLYLSPEPPEQPPPAEEEMGHGYFGSGRGRKRVHFDV